MKSSNISLRILTYLALVFLGVGAAQAAKPYNTTRFGNKAIGGYDTVAYFTEKKAVKGSAKFKTEWKGVVWQFASAENRAKFQEAPEKYAPNYGGYCSWAAANNKLVKANPKFFDVYNDKLYLNYNKKTQDEWRAAKESMIEDADKNFPGLIAKK